MKFISFLFILFALTQCGTTGSIILPEGVEDISCYEYPPESIKLNELSKKNDNEVKITTKQGNVITEEGVIICQPRIDWYDCLLF